MRESMTTRPVCQHETAPQDCSICQLSPGDLHTHFEGLLEEARPRLQRLARLYGVEPASIEDAVQETCVEAWQHLESLREPERFASWLDGICRNICKRYMRAYQKHARSAGGWYADEDKSSTAAFDLADPLAIDPAEELERQDMQVLLARALGYLPQAARELVELCYLVELPQREVAQRLDISLGALELKLHRARRQLRQILNNELHADAVEFGLLLNEDEAMSWQETRQWCWMCGNQRLRGKFERRPSGVVALRLRCPACSRHSECDILNTGDWPVVEQMRSFRPAIKQALLTCSAYHTAVLHQRCCPTCQSRVQLRIVDHTSLRISHDFSTFVPPGIYLQGDCPSCGSFTCGLINSLLDHPIIRNFLLYRPRVVYESNTLAALSTYSGQDAFRSCLVDLKSGERLTTMIHPETLEVMATILE